jgi:putative transposase
VNSITFPQSGFKILSDKRIQISKIGTLPFVLHRVPKGKIKTLTIKQNKVGQWFAIFSCEIPDVIVEHPSKKKIGIDVGLENFATLSNGEIIANPRHIHKAERKLKLLQRKFGKKKKGSANRRKARFRLAKQHLKVANQQTDFLHKQSRNLAFRFSTIAVEELNIQNMLKTHWLAKSISDASWNQFIQMLSYKEVTLGGQVVKNPRTRGSSKRCSGCGMCVDMPLAKRKFSCPNCGLVLHRDLNASINHIKDTVGLTEIYTPVEIRSLQLSNRLQIESSKQEL